MKNKLFLLFKGNELVNGSMKLISSNILLFLLPLIVTPILSRIYTPSDFGDWGVFSGSYSIVSVIIFLGLEQAIVKCKENKFPLVVKLCLYTSLIVILLISISFIILKLFGVEYFATFPSLTIFVIYLIFSSIIIVIQNIINRRELYTYMAWGSFLLGLGQAIFRILFSNSSFFNNGLIVGTVFATILNALFYIYAVNPKSMRCLLVQNSISDYKQCISENKRFPLFDAPASLFAFAALNLPIIVLFLFYGKESVGCFSMVIQLLLMPISLVGAAVGKVYYAKISKEGKLEHISQQILKYIAFCAILPTLFLALGGDRFLVFFLGEKWIDAGNYALCLMIWSIPTILTEPLIPLYRKLDKQQNLLLYNASYFILGICFLYLGCKCNLNICTTLFVFAVASSIAKIGLFIDILKQSKINFLQVVPNYLIILYVVTLSIAIFRIYNLL